MKKQDIYKEFVCLSKQVYDSSKANEKNICDLKNRPHLFFLGCVMDRQIKYEKAWAIPHIVASEIGDDSFKAFSEKSLEYYISLFQIKKLHRFNDKMARAFFSAVNQIENQYDSNASNLWSDEPSSAELVCRFLDFDSVGIKIATMAANILARDYKVPLKDYYSIDISPDVHVKRIFYRMGLITKNHDTQIADIDATKVIYKAREINPLISRGLLSSRNEHSNKGESLAEYYCRINGHLLKGIEVIEVDNSNSIRCVKR